ncbi:MAG: L-histidine N(alpha)-methyltransferase [Bacteroidales bacterium]|nr:L-histidine N(alpha)-methyltransferase [Bacteroidales bacterium]
MNYVNEDTVTLNRISITNLLQEIGLDEVRMEIASGLKAPQKAISSKYFYNREGSLLFEEITHLEEYYPTRTEKGILRKMAPDFMNRYPAYDLIELGPGDHSKISILLNAQAGLKRHSARYLPLDISQPAIRSSAEQLVSIFPNLQVEGYAVDFMSQRDLIRRKQPTVICFFGSTIGNFEGEESLILLKNISSQMKKGDVLLLGMDLIKPEAVLHAAYNDARGVTGAFNKNILTSVNNLIKTDFHQGDFDHLAFFNKEKSRMEMYLVANRDISIHSPHLQGDFFMKRGETIHTENSHKYSAEHIREIARFTGMQLNHIHTDELEWFAVAEFQKV